MNGPYSEIIRGEVSIRKMYAGGLLYFSSGSAWRGLRGSACPKAMESATSKPREVNKVIAARNNDEKIRQNRDGANVPFGYLIVGIALIPA